MSFPVNHDLCGREIKVGSYVAWSEATKYAPGVRPLLIGRVTEVPSAVDSDMAIVLNHKLNDVFKIVVFDRFPICCPLKPRRIPSNKYNKVVNRFILLPKGVGKKIEQKWRIKANSTPICTYHTKRNKV